MPPIVDFDQGLNAIYTWLGQASRPALIAIAGMTCSGKSTLADRLKQRLGQKAVVVPLDNFFREHSDPLLPLNDQDKMIFDLPESHNIPEFVGVINRLLGGYEATLPYFDKPSAERVQEKYQIIPAAPVIITEGLYTIRFLKRFQVNSLMVYVKADPEVCLKRKIDRDLPIFNVTPDQVRKTFTTKVLPYLPHIASQEAAAQLVITT